MRKIQPDEPNRPVIAIVILVVFVIAIVLAVVFAGGDDEGGGGGGSTTTTTEPPPVDDGPYQDELTDALKDAGFTDRDDWDDDWDQVGIVTDVGDKSLKVMTTEDFVFLTSEGGDSGCMKPIPITDMGSPGDIVAWLDEGEDSIVCDGEMALLWDAPKPEPEPEPAKG